MNENTNYAIKSKNFQENSLQNLKNYGKNTVKMAKKMYPKKNLEILFTNTPKKEKSAY